jgi:methylenetetrahydrofolate dehydrogenase (NADP+)/methenyltetrahydrofolate cyclohydrolase
VIIDGNRIAQEKLESLKKGVAGMARKPKLAIVLVGDDPASKIYVNLKVKKAAKIGIETEIRQDLDTDADGIIVQLPGGEGLIDHIPLEKDVDGLRKGSSFLPATVRAVLELVENKNGQWVIVGQGRLVGRPLADLLKSKSLKVITCDINTPDLKSETLKGDILVVATGVPNLIKADMVKSGAVVIDCGAPRAEVDFENVKNVAGAITPVPGGVGPMTVISLLENLVEATYNNTQSNSHTQA